MRINTKKLDKELDDYEDKYYEVITTPRWEKWFAWHPVRVDHNWVWLEYVTRLYSSNLDRRWYEYRFENENNDK